MYEIFFLVLAALAILLVFSLRPDFGLFAMALSLPVINWNFDYGSLSVSFIEIVSLFVLTAYVLRLIAGLLKKQIKFSDIKWPHFWPFVFFLFVAFLSGFFSRYIGFSLWYVIRWLVFAYLAYFWLPFNIIKDEKVLKRTLLFLTASGFLVAVIGLISLAYQDWYNSFFRIQPIGILGVYPLGYNHNLIAEFLVIITFFTLSLKYWLNSERSKRLIDILFGFLLIITIGTFSRTGWIVLGIEALIYIFFAAFYLKKPGFNFKNIVLGFILACLLISPLAFRMLKLQEENTSSTENRIILTQISWRAFLNKPLLGYGTGMFVNLVDNNLRFRAKYGDPLDSHGVWQKIIAENGFLGFVAFFLLLLFLFRKLYLAIVKNIATAELLLPLFIGSLGGLIYQFFNTSYYKGKLWFPIALAYSAAYLIIKKKNEGKRSEKN